MATGKFITFEGGEGTGKSTHVALLAQRLRDQGHTVTETREPGGTPQAEAVRSLLVTGETDRWSAQAEALLNYAARDSHLEGMIKPALASGAWVVCDRYIDSTRAYQGYAGGADPSLLASLEQAIVGEVLPDLTFVLDLDPQIGLARAGHRAKDSSADESRFEAKGLEFHTTLRDAFLDIARREPGRCVVLDASGAKEEIAEAVWRQVASRLGA